MLPESAAVLPNQLKRDLSEEEERSLSHPPSPADIEKAVAIGYDQVWGKISLCLVSPIDDCRIRVNGWRLNYRQSRSEDCLLISAKTRLGWQLHS